MNYKSFTFTQAILLKTDFSYLIGKNLSSETPDVKIESIDVGNLIEELYTVTLMGFSNQLNAVLTKELWQYINEENVNIDYKKYEINKL